VSAALPEARQAPRALRLTRGRVFILPTGHGALLAAVLLVMLVGAANYANALAFLLTFLLAGVALVSMVHAYRNLAGLRIEALDAEPVLAGAHARFPVLIDNRGGPPRRALLLHALPAEDGIVQPFCVPADTLLRRLIEIPTRRRGRLLLPQVTVATRFPLGLFRAWSPLRPAASCLVYPRPAGLQPLPAASAEDGRDGRIAGAGRDDFAGLREYRRGDSPRHIHWRAAARGDRLPVKLFSGAGPGVLTLDWAAVRADGTEARLAQLCRWVLEAESGGARYALRLPGTRIEPAAGAAHRSACLEALACYGEPR